jgi:hypothetical protein
MLYGVAGISNTFCGFNYGIELAVSTYTVHKVVYYQATFTAPCQMQLRNSSPTSTRFSRRKPGITP